jgi:hypothetical protein
MPDLGAPWLIDRILGHVSVRVGVLDCPCGAEVRTSVPSNR